MKEQQKGLVLLIKSALMGKKEKLPENLDYLEMVSVAQKHNIIPLVYYGGYNCGIVEKQEQLKQLFPSVCKKILYSEKQAFVLKEIEKAFEQAGVDYQSLKGARLREYYSRPEFRWMSDIDILIKVEQYPIIKKIMLDLGFNELVESDHELIWGDANIKIELHKRLIPSYNTDYYAYFGDGWKFAKPVPNKKHAYEMKKEDELIYLFTHFCKHYRDSGVGIKHILDIWVYTNAHPDIDYEYVKEQLKILRIYEFYKNVKDTLSVWFEGAEPTEKTDFITDAIINYGVIDANQAKVLSATLKKVNQGKSVARIKWETVFTSLFVPYRTMCNIYPWLKKVCVLLPFMWVYHLFRRLFTKGKIKEYNSRFSEIKGDKIDAYRESLNYVGLDYNFGENKEENKND